MALFLSKKICSYEIGNEWSWLMPLVLGRIA
jgi:hypothetical protein